MSSTHFCVRSWRAWELTSDNEEVYNINSTRFSKYLKRHALFLCICNVHTSTSPLTSLRQTTWHPTGPRKTIGSCQVRLTLKLEEVVQKWSHCDDTNSMHIRKLLIVMSQASDQLDEVMTYSFKGEVWLLLTFYLFLEITQNSFVNINGFHGQAIGI